MERVRLSMRFPSDLLAGVDVLAEQGVGKASRTSLFEEAVRRLLKDEGISIDSPKVRAAAKRIEADLTAEPRKR